MLDNKFVASYLKDAHSEVKALRPGRQAILRTVETPGLGTVAGFGGKRTDKETFYSYTSYSTPATIYRYDLESGQSTVFRSPR